MSRRTATLRTRPIEPSVADDPDRLFTIGELAAAFGITTRAIRFYETKGLISPARKGVARSYSRRDRARLLLIMRGKNLGFSLEEIVEFLGLYDADPSQMAQTRHLLGKVEAHIADLEAKRKDLERTLRDLKEIRTLCVAHLTPKAG
jgi:DNA-binding transcriptional MerR regulator